MQCRFVDTGYNDAFTNMAIDEAILLASEKSVLRIYQWKPSAITLGYSQDLQEINLEQCKNLKIDVVRRITGGKAVFHENEITYSFILPQTNLLPKDITESYKEIAKSLQIALKKIGIKAEMKKQPEKIPTSICFNSSNWYELIVNNKKISGSAQRRLKGKILQHGSIITDFDYEKNALLFSSNNPLDTSENLKKRITSIKKELKKDIAFPELKQAINYGFQKNFNFEFQTDNLTNGELKLADKLRNKKYLTDEWNLNKKANNV